MCKRKLIHIGTSGWHYKHWLGTFYPNNFSEKDFLNYYKDHFCTVEVNNSFYHLPQEKTIVQWRETAPEDFIFSVKASRYITHMKKLIDPEKSTALFFDRIEAFGDKLGPILFQLPPRFGFNPERLKAFLNILPKNYKHVLEFRDPSWFNPMAYDLMRENNVAFCIYYLGDFQSPKEITADFVYIRYHGPVTLGAGLYNKDDINNFSNDIKGYMEQGKQVFAYFNNDQAGFATQNAAELQQILS
ncbi:MAG: hypothetical protein A2104_00545 [Candidatus Melainabacteria bacterium GWF2_32_7]|nr:MAG: hypothetical protein A2104_00545 [Candidatus Melainabacteria bacterium GWF2_32_7]